MLLVGTDADAAQNVGRGGGLVTTPLPSSLDIPLVTRALLPVLCLPFRRPRKGSALSGDPVSTHPQRSEVGLARDALVLHELDPVSIRVEDERHILHAAVRQPLLPVDVERLEAGAGGLDVVDRDA